MLLRGQALQVREDFRDDLRFLDAGNELELSAATRTGLHLHGARE